MLMKMLIAKFSVGLLNANSDGYVSDGVQLHRIHTPNNHISIQPVI